MTFAEVVDQALAMLQRRESLGNVVVPSAICHGLALMVIVHEALGWRGRYGVLRTVVLGEHMATVLTEGLGMSSA